MLRRQQELFQFLIENHPSSMDDCCMYMEVSKPTLKSDISYLNEMLQDFSVQIIFDNQKIYFSDMNLAIRLAKIIESFVFMDIKDKMQLLLLLEKEPIVLQEIADKLYVSKSKISMVANELTHQISSFVRANHLGYSFDGDDALRKELFISLLFPYFKGVNFKEEFLLFCRHQLDLSTYFHVDEVEKSTKIVEEFSEDLDQPKDGELTQIFLTSLFIQRQEKNLTHVELSKCLLNELVWLNSMAKKEYLNENIQIVREMLSYVDRLLGTQFHTDEELEKGLVQHIDFSWKENAHLVQESLELLDIKKRFPLSYEASVLAAQFLKEKELLYLRGDELIYLAIHFQNSVEKKKRKNQSIKAIILTPYGLTSGKLIENQLTEEFRQLEIIKILSQSEFLYQQELLQDIDLVLSLSYVEIETKPVIFLPLVLSDESLKEIAHFLYRKENEHQIEEMIDEALIYESKKIEDPYQIIHFFNEQLLSGGFVDELYLDSMIDREETASTSIKGIAVPHGKMSHVKKDKLIVLRLESSIIWGDYHVDWVFLLALTERSMKDRSQLFNYFYRTVAQKRFYLELQKISKDTRYFRNQIKELF